MDLTDRFERLEAFEERAGCRLEALYANLASANDASNIVRVFGEVHSREGMNLGKSINLALTVYDTTGRLVGQSIALFDANKFFGFATFELAVVLPKLLSVTKFRVIPRIL